MHHLRLFKNLCCKWHEVYPIQSCIWKSGLRSTYSKPLCHVLQRHMATISKIEDENAGKTYENKAAVVSKAMKAYLERSAEHEKFMKEEVTTYEIGKRHLANMMGEDPETFTQDDINRAISYLLPSGLYDPRARPQMEHPTKLYAKRKAAEFNEMGRPFHPLFYTGFPAYFQLLQDIAIMAGKLDNLAERSKETTAAATKLELLSTKWVDKQKFEQIVLEKVYDNLYDFFINSMERLLKHPFAYKEKEFFLRFREEIVLKKADEETPKLMLTDLGIPYMTHKSKRKTAFAEVTVYGHGTGVFEVNGKDILYFENHQDREQILFPLQFTKLIKSVNVKATVEGGGSSGQAGAIRHSIAMALRSFVDDNMIERMRIAGLLTRDARRHERKKPGQRGARAKQTWKKR